MILFWFKNFHAYGYILFSIPNFMRYYTCLARNTVTLLWAILMNFQINTDWEVSLCFLEPGGHEWPWRTGGRAKIEAIWLWAEGKKGAKNVEMQAILKRGPNKECMGSGAGTEVGLKMKKWSATKQLGWHAPWPFHPNLCSQRETSLPPGPGVVPWYKHSLWIFSSSLSIFHGHSLYIIPFIH